MNTLLDRIHEAKVIAITGHVRPDGDCVGSTTALYFYILENYPDKLVYITLEQAPASVRKCIDCSEIIDVAELPENINLFISLDASSADRLGGALEKFEKADFRFVIDHHKTNTNFGDTNIVNPSASSSCEVLFELLDDEKISVKTATSLYLGIVHDTGVFKYSSTSSRTMEIAGKLLDKGVDSAFIIDGSFYEKTWIQNKILAKAIDKAEITDDGKIAYTVLTLGDMKEIGASNADTEGIVEQLRLTESVEIAAFLRQEKEDTFKVSLRAKKGLVDVSEISLLYNGGGHRMAAGFTAEGSEKDIINNIISEIYKRWTA